MKAKFYSVTQVNKYIKNLINNDIILNDIFVEAEISNFKNHSSGHFYFTLKDENSSINAIMFKLYSDNIVFNPKNGIKVIVYGNISIYEKTGQYQLYVKIMEPSGKGSLYLAFEQLKSKLYEEGLFDNSNKKSIPVYPKCIAVITSPTGAAVRDIINISKRRNNKIKLTIIPALVQGDEASLSIVKAIKTANEWGKPDLIILGRGGGSIEDLWAFNEEIVARAIFKSKIPIISAVGHETDYTISDFVSDLRAPTPSAAAELAVPKLDDINKLLNNILIDLNRNILIKINKRKDLLNNILNDKMFKNPLKKVFDTQIYVEDIENKIYKSIKTKLEKYRFLFINLSDSLENLSPVNIVKKGYSLAYDENYNMVKSINDIDINSDIRVEFKDGYIKSKVLEKEFKNG